MRYYVRKLCGLFITLLIVSLAAFLCFSVLPGDPAEIILGLDADPLQLEAMRSQLGLDKSIAERYLSWLSGLFKGDLGVSLRYSQNVSDLIRQAFKVTFALSIVSLVLTVVIALPIGLWLGSHSKKKYSLPVSITSQIALSVPSFCMAIFLISIFSVKLNVLPSIGYTPLSEGFVSFIKSLLLPSLSIAIGSASILIRYIKVSVEKEERMDYVRTAKSKGMKNSSIMLFHVLKNSLIPTITTLGLICADILGGSIIIENIFSLPGIGRLITVSISSRDLPLIQGLVLYLASIVALCNFVVDIVYSLVDPRIRLS